MDEWGIGWKTAKYQTKFGDKLCFWGTIDEQYTLPFRTPDGVKKEVETRLDTIGRKGVGTRFIFEPIPA